MEVSRPLNSGSRRTPRSLPSLSRPPLDGSIVGQTGAQPDGDVNTMPKQSNGSTEDNWPVLNGPGCILRVLTVADAADWYRGEDEEQRRWFDFPSGPPPRFEVAVAGVKRCIESWRTAWRDGGPQHHWGIWTEDGRRLSGGVEVRVRPDRRGNVSYVVFPNARRRGLATLAVRLAAEWAFSHLDIVGLVAIVDERNVASRRVALAAGFALEGPAEPWEYSESGVMLRYAHSRDSRQPPGGRS
jgi:RimJ/RimL family protein N-acetyltransferase